MLNRSIAPELTEHLTRYTLVRPLDHRGPEQIYLAEDKTARRRVAIKALAEDTTLTPEANARLRQSLIRGAMTADKLHHPGIVAIHEIGAPPDGVFVVMEYLEGGSLDQKL